MYLRQLFSGEAIGSGGSRPRPLPGTRNLLPPGSAHLPDYLAVVSGLPDVDAPALFGLPANVDRAAQQVNSARVVQQLRQLAASQVGDLAENLFDQGLF